MLNMIAHMTQAEKDATLKQIADYEVGCKVDEEVTLEAWEKYDLYIGDIIHFNMMKCDLISQTDLPVFPFSAEDYRDILAEKTEEERRHKLCEILAIKTLEYRNKMENQTSLITKEDDEKNNIIGGIDVNRLQSLIERIEHLEEEKKSLSGDIRDIYAEAKSAGFDTKIMRMIIKLRKMNVEDRDEQEFLLEAYRKAMNI